MKTIVRTLLASTVLIASAAVAADNPPLVEAEVRKVDTAAAKITLKHGEIPNLDMPPMTMVFQAREPAQLDGLKTGDKVQFRAEKVNGAYRVFDLGPQR
jgi:Cu/Ag efflux protein CusF